MRATEQIRSHRNADTRTWRLMSSHEFRRVAAVGQSNSIGTSCATTTNASSSASFARPPILSSVLAACRFGAAATDGQFEPDAARLNPLDTRVDQNQNHQTSGESSAARQGDAAAQQSERSAAAQLLRRASNSGEQTSSADLPAEFRGADDEPKEQSKLAKLCEQTSSVLASVLPAPFGGHKRSILCQFFGQVQLGGKAKPSAAAATTKRPLNQLALNRLAGLQVQPPFSQQVETLESIAVLHQNRQPPITMLANGRHPIELVLAQQRILAAAASRANQQQLTAAAAAEQQPPQVHVPAVALKSNQQASANSLVKNVKFSAPLVGVSSTTQAVSTSGWRIFNASTAGNSGESSATAPLRVVGAPTSTTSTTSRPDAELVLETLGERANSTSLGLIGALGAEALQRNDSSKPKLQSYLSARTIVVGDSTAGGSRRQQLVELGKRTSESLKATTRSLDLSAGGERMSPQESSEQLSTIEIVSQDNNLAEGLRQSPNGTRSMQMVRLSAAATNQQQNVTSASAQQQPRTQSPGSDAAGQVQKREELVIASINNLTRIAFGNQLRDTVKVINKLIDEQVDLFGGKQQTTRQSKLAPAKKTNELGADSSDQMLTSESRQTASKQTVAVASQDLRAPEKAADWPLKKTSAKAAGGQQSGRSFRDSAAAGETKAALVASHVKLATTRQKQIPSAAKPTGRRPQSGQNAAIGQTSLTAASAATNKKSATLNRDKPTKSTTTTTSTTRRPTSRKSLAVVQNHELRRLSAASRAPPVRGGESTRVAKSNRSSRDGGSELEDLATVSSISHFSRIVAPLEVGLDKSGWSPSTSNKLLLESKAFRTTSMPQAKVAAMVQPTVTKFPWLLPEVDTFSRAELFGSSGGNSQLAAELRKSTTVGAPKNWLTTKKMLFSTTPLGGGSSLTIANKEMAPLIELGDANKRKFGQEKQDSLTTLKMLVAPSTRATTTTTRLPFSSGSQSRWIPSTLMTTLAPKSRTTIRMLLQTTTLPPSIAPTSLATRKTTTVAPTTTIAPTSGWPQSEPIGTKQTLDELNEVRASESISRYTTHLVDSNELLVAPTTARRNLLQPLPKIANTGDYFSAETISNWPERYQTMISQSLEEAPQKATTSSFSTTTTRRNGETFENTNSATTATLARHRLDSNLAAEQTTRQHFLGSLITPNMTGVTVLPSNHKLAMTTTKGLGGDRSAAVTEFNVDGDERGSGASSAALAAAGAGDKVQTATEPSAAQRQRTPPYTTVFELAQGALATGEANGLEIAAATSKQPFDYSTRPQTNTSASALRPPYFGDATGDEGELSEPSLVLDATQSRPHVAQKIHDLLSPPNYFSGGGNSRQKFNLSALKYLAQSLVSRSTKLSEHLGAAGESNRTAVSQGLANGNTSSANEQTASRLIDLVGSESTSTLPLNYYELLLNESAPILESDESRRNSTLSGAPKTIFGRAGSLLNELKQLEHKRAAALLAAIRYQVPGPLLRPWDLASDLNYGGGGGALAGLLRASDRLDSSGTGGNQEKLLVDQLVDGIKSALFRQRVVPRDELEARLNGSSQGSFTIDRSLLSLNSNRRIEGDDTQKIVGEQSVASIGLQANQPHSTDFEYLVPIGADGSRAERTKSARDYLLGKVSKNSTSIEAKLTETEDMRSDFETIELANSTKLKDQTAFRDHSSIRNRQAMSERVDIARRQHSNSFTKSRNQEFDLSKSRLRPAIQEGHDEKAPHATLANRNDRIKVKAEFDCYGRSAGFYPDVESACQNFYHCSSTGHLLTFNCPSQTRYDERSLKCGPWYEVPCDLGRVRSA